MRLFRNDQPVRVCSDDFSLGETWHCLSSFCVSIWALSKIHCIGRK